jgi:hypothetical protein
MHSGFPLVSSSELIVVHSSAEVTLAVVLVMLLVVGCWCDKPTGAFPAVSLQIHMNLSPSLVPCFRALALALAIYVLALAYAHVAGTF